MSNSKSISKLLILKSSPLSSSLSLKKKNLGCERIYRDIYFLSFQHCVYEKPQSSWGQGHADELHDTAVISVLNACLVFEPTKVSSAYMCVLYMVFWSDSVFEFFLALFLAEFNPQLSSLENL